MANRLGERRKIIGAKCTLQIKEVSNCQNEH